MTWFFILCSIGLISLIIYWQLIIAEGTYLGARVVAFTYDWVAERYNSIKEFEPEIEDMAIGEPLMNILAQQPRALVLDVATGTGRVPLTLLRQADFEGRVVGLDRARRMLAVARRDTDRDRVYLLQADAMALPFADNTFPVVTCLEAMEFMPSPHHGLQEMVRVLAPATATHPERGWLITSRRVGWEAWLMPGKTWSQEQLHELLEQLAMRYISIQPWETIYDLVMAQKVNE